MQDQRKALIQSSHLILHIPQLLLYMSVTLGEVISIFFNCTVINEWLNMKTDFTKDRLKNQKNQT